MNDVASFLDQYHADLSPVERALRLGNMEDAREAALERQREAARAARAQERVELLQLAYRQGGIQPGEIQRLQSLAAEADDECRDLADRLAKAEAKRSRVTGNLESLLRQVDQVNQAVASRAAPPEDPVEAAVFRAREEAREHAEFLRATREAWQAVQAGKGSRPFVSGGVAVRSEPVTCPACIAVGATPEEAFWIHHSTADGEPLATSSDEPVRVPPDDADRSVGGYSREITRGR